MAIKSDRWIKQMCTPPTFIITEMVAVQNPNPGNHDVYYLPAERKRAVHMTEEQIKAEMQRCEYQATGIKHYRPVEETDLVAANWKPMIEPFTPNQVRRQGDNIPQSAILAQKHMDEKAHADFQQWCDQKIVSYGTSSYGYDVRCADEFKIFTNINSTIVDPKNFDPKSFVDFKGDVCIIPPNSFALARTVERFAIPRNVLTVCLGKSTYARCGIIVNVTPFEPEWEGYVTLEFSNTTPLPAKIYANEGCAQVLFFESDEVCETSYKDRGGKYQSQEGVVVPRV